MPAVALTPSIEHEVNAINDGQLIPNLVHSTSTSKMSEPFAHECANCFRPDAPIGIRIDHDSYRNTSLNVDLVDRPFPTSEQQAAIRSLGSLSEPEILVCLALLRSFDPGFHHRCRPGSLSCQQVDALTALSLSRDERIIDWLHLHRHNGQRESRKALTEGCDNRASLASTFSNASSSSAASSFQGPGLSSSTSRNTPRTSCGSSYSGGTRSAATRLSNISNRERPSHVSSASGLSDVAIEESFGDKKPPPVPKKNGHTHWCTSCENSHAFETCDGYKRHEKEHHQAFQCMPEGARENVNGEWRCAFCDIRDPSQEHFAVHKVGICRNKLAPCKKTRKTDMIAHLARHGIEGEKADALADKWRATRRMKALACGFCEGRWFTDQNAQLKHLDSDHFAKGHRISDWNNDRVIRALLMQPTLIEKWREISNNIPNVTGRLSTWNQDVTKKLQSRLELMEDPPRRLVEDALNLSNEHKFLQRVKSASKSLASDRIAESTSPIFGRTNAGARSTTSSGIASRQPQHQLPAPIASHSVPLAGDVAISTVTGANMDGTDPWVTHPPEYHDLRSHGRFPLRLNSHQAAPSQSTEQFLTPENSHANAAKLHSDNSMHNTSGFFGEDWQPLLPTYVGASDIQAINTSNLNASFAHASDFIPRYDQVARAAHEAGDQFFSEFVHDQDAVTGGQSRPPVSSNDHAVRSRSQSPMDFDYNLPQPGTDTHYAHDLQSHFDWK